MLHTVAREIVLCLAMRLTDATPAKDANGFRLGITMPAFHRNGVDAQRPASATPRHRSQEFKQGSVNEIHVLTQSSCTARLGKRQA